MPDPKIVLYFDVVSPFAYMAFHVLRTSPVFAPCHITYIPVFLGGIMHKTGNRPPLAVKNKGKWIAQERLRWSHQFQIPMADEIPPGFPANTITIMRALTVITELYPQQLEPILAAIYETSFVKRELVHTVDAAKSILGEFLGMAEAEEVLVKAASPEVKQRLVQNTDEAIESGAFGLPWMRATDSRGVEAWFWGFDHLGQVCEYLGLGRPSSGGVSDVGWRAML